MAYASIAMDSPKNGIGVVGNKFTIVCLDLNTDPNEKARRRLIIGNMETFYKIYDCRNYIEENKNRKIVLIAVSYLGRIIISKIHDLPQLNAVYIYCDNKEETEQWTRQYQKVSVYIL